MLQRFQRFMARTRLMVDERGANILEYLMLTALIALACFAAWQTFGSNVKTKVSSAADKVSSMSF